jgi:GNAT superfamily N-acetyltransferase
MMYVTAIPPDLARLPVRHVVEPAASSATDARHPFRPHLRGQGATARQATAPSMHGVSEAAGAGSPLQPTDVGTRVSIRFRRDDGLLADVVGDLVALDDTQLRLRRRDGLVTTVPKTRVLATRRVPASVRDILALEELSGRTWPARHETWLGRWWLRAAGGFSARADASRLLGDPDRPVAEAFDAVRAWYRDHGVEPQLRLVAGSRFEAAAAAAGFQPTTTILVLAAPIARVRSRIAERSARFGGWADPGAGGRVGVVRTAVVRLESRPWTGWLAMFRGGTASHAADLLATPREVVFAAVEHAGDVLAIGRGARDEDWVELSAVEVRPTARRQGLAHRIIDAILEWAGGLGALRVFLEVAEANGPARSLYAQLGFTEHHRYRWWKPAEGADRPTLDAE